MTNLYQNTYRIPSARLQNWDYIWNAAYFVTICTHERECFFGEIVNDKMKLNDVGKYANQYWLDIPKHFSFVKLDNHVVMPNHLHGIIIIDKPDDIVETLHATSLRQRQSTPTRKTFKNEYMASISPKSGSLSTIIRSYKSSVTKNARLVNSNFAWQFRFHDHIIRDDESFNNISEYINNNSSNWQEDEFYKS